MTSHLSIVDRLPQTVSSKEVITLLEEYLARAKAGEVVALGIAAATLDGTMLTAVTTAPNGGILLGAATRLMLRIDAAIEEFKPDGGAA